MSRTIQHGLAAAICLALLAVPASAWVPPEVHPSGAPDPDGLSVVDGSYVMNVGELHMNITNHGLLGSKYSIVSTFSEAPSGQWPGGSGIEYLFCAGLWVGGVQHGEKLVSTGQYEAEFRPRRGPDHTIYEARYGRRIRPTPQAARQGARIFEPSADDDGDGMINEDRLDGLDNDGDGLVDEDFEMMGSQMMVCTMVDNTELSREEYPDHDPMDLEIRQTAYAWEMEEIDDFIVVAYDIKNIGTSPISSVYLGMFVDCDIGYRDRGEAAFDDLAGYYNGVVRAPNGIYESVDVAYMRDGSQRDPVPGSFGVMFRGPSTAQHRIRSFQRYSADRPYALGGLPTNDAERYNELAKTRSDPDVEEDTEGDYRMLVSNGPWGTLFPGRSIHLEVVFVMGDGLEGMLETCSSVQQVWEGAWYDLDDDPWTGRNGQESLVCIQDYGLTLNEFALSPLKDWDARYADLSCVPDWAVHLITPLDLDHYPDDRDCIWVNLDNCDECEALRGAPCSRSNFFSFWNCNRWYIPLGQKVGCTGIGGRESVVRWITHAAPPPPRMRVWPTDRAVHVYWSDEPEYSLDFIDDDQDFESYQVWRADDWSRPAGTSEATGPSSELWQLIAEYDLDNVHFAERDLGNETYVDTLPLGNNTGLEPVLYRPRCLDDPQYDGLAAAMEQVFAAGAHRGTEFRPPLRDPAGNVYPSMASLLPWEYHTAVLDTFFWATPWAGGPGEIPAKRAVRFYEYVDDSVNNGFLYFYSVCTTDHAMYMDGETAVITGPGVDGDPATSFVTARPGTSAQNADDIAATGSRVYVYPNPATQESLAEFQQMFPNSDDPTGVRVMFANLPRTRAAIEIYTLDGDLVQVLDHDGSNGSGEAPWNMVSRNGQQIVSGVYLYVVRPYDRAYDDFVGKFVVIR